MAERLLGPDDAVLECPISYSELTCVVYDLQFVGDDVAVANARAALLRAAGGPPAEEAWMRSESSSGWDEQVSRVIELLG